MTPSSSGPVAVFTDLEEEDERLEAILAGLAPGEWAAPSAAAGWTVVDVVIHLAQTDEAVVQTAAGADPAGFWRTEGAGTLDEAMDRAVRAESASPDLIFERWRTARRAALRSLRQADPNRPLRWAAAPLRPRALATTRLAEHWAHGLDITAPLGIPFPDTDRLRHVAWLAHRTLPYALSLSGDQAREVFCELSGPRGDIWTFGPPDADSAINGPAGEFCRVGARRLAPEASHLTTRGPHAAAALRALRNYAV